MTTETFENGLQIVGDMFGPETAQGARDSATDFSRPFFDRMIRYCFGETWTGTELTRRERSLITLAILIALGKDSEIKMHTRGAIKNGATVDEIRGVLMHAMIYCGVPAAVGGLRAMEESLAALKGEAK